jgi:NADH-quinone oxidoreductase subunit C
MPLLSQGQLRQILERDLPGVLDPTKYTPVSASAHATHQLAVEDRASATGGDTSPPPATGDAAAEQDAAEGEGVETAAPPLFETDVVVRAERIIEVAQFMRDRLGYNYLSRVTAIDYPAYGLIEVVYHFYRIEGGSGQVVRVRVPRDNAVIPSITPIWPGANLEERVCWDLFGVQFPGHPYHKRIYMWDEFEGHPMRKDFEKVGDSYYHFKWKGSGGEEE